MKKKSPIILLLMLLCGGCSLYHKSVHAVIMGLSLYHKSAQPVTMECLSNGLVFFNQDGIYYFPKDSCCFLQESDKDIDGLILENTVSQKDFRLYEYNDMERLKAGKYYCKYAPDVSRRTIPGVNDNTYFIKSDSCYIVFARIRMYSYRELDKRLERIYPWEVSIAGQNIRANIVDGRGVYFDIERTEAVDSIRLADFLMNKN